jgi:hypothetical protein
VDVASTLWIGGGGDAGENGVGVMNVYDGAVTCTALYLGQDADGTLNLYGGSVTADALEIWGPSPPDTIYYGGGVLLLTGDQVAVVESKLHRMDTMDPSKYIAYDYDFTTPGMTTVWQAPEPASLALFGFGSLLLLMRRRR